MAPQVQYAIDSISTFFKILDSLCLAHKGKKKKKKRNIAIFRVNYGAHAAITN